MKAPSLPAYTSVPEPAGAPRLQGLPPVVSQDTAVLVLGSFPGGRSLAMGQYYAHPQNHFWRILQAVWPAHVLPDGYAQRLQWLLARGLGLWDVYASCEREGSLDTSIRHAVVNDFAALARRLPRLAAMAHNGGESWRHARHAASLGLPAHKLPSSSPANASWRFERKLDAWRAVFTQYGLV